MSNRIALICRQFVELHFIRQAGNSLTPGARSPKINAAVAF
jgi:hypothetical protein